MIMKRASRFFHSRHKMMLFMFAYEEHEKSTWFWINKLHSKSLHLMKTFRMSLWCDDIDDDDDLPSSFGLVIYSTSLDDKRCVSNEAIQNISSKLTKTVMSSAWLISIYLERKWFFLIIFLRKNGTHCNATETND